MTVRQFEKRIAPVLEQYVKYNIKAHKVWKENNQAFDKDGKLIRSSYGSRRDYMFTRILMKRIEEACMGEQRKK